MRVREYYGYALIAGISHEEAEDMLLGYILDTNNPNKPWCSKTAHNEQTSPLGVHLYAVGIQFVPSAPFSVHQVVQ